MKKLFLLFLLLAFALPVNAFNPLLVCTGAVASGGENSYGDTSTTSNYDVYSNNRIYIWKIGKYQIYLRTNDTLFVVGATDIVLCSFIGDIRNKRRNQKIRQILKLSIKEIKNES